MSQKIGWFDRLRIERLVWALDQQLYDLPRAARIATRREVRTNLLDAARDVGTAAAIARVGGSRRLAEQYLAAEFGDGPRHSWVAAVYTLSLVPLLLFFFMQEAANGFQEGVLTVDPMATGSYAWHGVTWLQAPGEITFTNGQPAGLGGPWTPLTYVLWLLVTIAAGRLWRLPIFRRRRRDGNGRSPASTGSELAR